VSWDQASPEGYLGSVHRVVKHVVLKNIIRLAASGNANPVTKAITHNKLTDLQTMLSGKQDADSQYGAHLIAQYLTNPEEFEVEDAPSPPPGSPIGSGGMYYCEF
jgi:hypothetical protein